MEKSTLIITPETKINDLLINYPHLEDVLIEVAPEFRKLKNPVLRKTIAKVTSLKQAALIAEISIEKLINKLRTEAGQNNLDIIHEVENNKDKPDWFNTSKIIETLDARPILNEGEHPLDKVVRRVRDLKDGEIFELTTPFQPIPLINKIEAIGYASWSVKIDADIFKTYFNKSPD